MLPSPILPIRRSPGKVKSPGLKPMTTKPKPTFSYPPVDTILEARAYTVNTKPLVEEIVFPERSVERIIQRDDIEKLVKVFSEGPFYDFSRNFTSNVMHQPMSLLSIAARCKAWECFKYLVRKGHDITEDVIIQAIIGGDMRILKRVSKEQSYDLGDYLHIAIEYRQNEIADWIMRNFNHLPINLITAAKAGNSEAVFYYLNNKIGSPDIRDREGNSALHWAAAMGESFIVDLLCDQGANPSALNNGNFLPIHYAIKKGYLDIAKILVQRGSDLKTENTYRQTPLSMALEMYPGLDREIIKMLTPPPDPLEQTYIMTHPSEHRRRACSPYKPRPSTSKYVKNIRDREACKAKHIKCQYTNHYQEHAYNEDHNYSSSPNLVHDSTLSADSTWGREGRKIMRQRRNSSYREMMTSQGAIDRVATRPFRPLTCYFDYESVKYPGTFAKATLLPRQRGRSTTTYLSSRISDSVIRDYTVKSASELMDQEFAEKSVTSSSRCMSDRNVFARMYAEAEAH